MKIRAINLNNYRAFLINSDEENERYKIELPNGENLLIYGENGSGKSSLFRGMKDFFISANSKTTFNANLFYKEEENTEPPYISLKLDNNEEYFFSSDNSKTNNVHSQEIKKANITKGFISYRDLLKIHYRDNYADPDLFSFFLGSDGLFSDSLIINANLLENRTSFQLLWNKIKANKNQEDIDDYNDSASSRFEELEKSANKLLAYFTDDCFFKIAYEDCKLSDVTIEPPAISFDVQIFGKSIIGHHDFLNEARLTSIAISIYLAHLLSLPPSELQILFLDDIFIGLDMSNRIPLIKLLTADDLGDGLSFKNHQIFMTTYDREWFNVAKNYLGEGWKNFEFYVDNHNDIDRPFIRRSETYLERAEFHFNHGDYPACANYLRKEFEKTLKKILPENSYFTKPEDHPILEGNIIIAKEGMTISEKSKAWVFKRSTEEEVLPSGIQASFLSLQGLIDLFKNFVTINNISFPFINELFQIKSRILNPLSHDDMRVSTFKNELKMGFLILEELHKIKSSIIFDISEETKIFLYQDQIVDGIAYTFKYEMTTTLHAVEYNGMIKLLDVKCIFWGWITKADGLETIFPEPSIKSLKTLCKKQHILGSVDKTEAEKSFDETTIPNIIYTAENKFLIDYF